MYHLLFDNPSPCFFLLFVLSFLLLTRWKSISPHRLLRWSSLLGTTSIVAYLFINVLNIYRVGMIWHDEANILSIAAAYCEGEPIYHAVTAPAFYSLFYGPSTFLIFGLFLAIFPHPIPAIKIGIFVANSIELLLLFIAMRTWASRPVALSLFPIATTFLLAYPGVLLGMRGDPWLLCCITLAAVCALRGTFLGPIGSAVIAGILGGFAVDFKATVAPAVCLVFAIIYRRYGFRASLVSATASIATALGIFSLPHISLRNYVAWLIISSHQRFLKSTCLGNLVAAGFLLAPIVCVMILGSKPVRVRRSSWSVPLLGAFALIICIVTGSKDGAGLWHLWPMLPFLLITAAYQFSERFETLDQVPEKTAAKRELDPDRGPARTSIVLASIAVAGTFVSMYFSARAIAVVRPTGGSEWRTTESSAQRSVESIIARSSPGENLSMGYGRQVTDYRTDLRFELPLANQDYFFDENSVVEGVKAGFPIPAGVLHRILGCRDTWIIPHGEAPFSAVRIGVLPVTTTAYIFPDELRLHFADSHMLFQQGDVFDIWKCR